MADFASCSAEELQQLAATLSDAERQTLREALRLLEAEEKEQVTLAETVALCLKEKFIVESEVRQVFLNGDRLFNAQAGQEEVREQLGALEYLELAEAKVGAHGLATLAQFAKWTDQNFPGFVKMWGCVVENRDVPVKESKVIGVMYTKTGDTLESHLLKQEVRNDHRMYLAMTAFQAWKHSLYTTPCLSVFTMENLVVIADAEAPGGYRTQIRIQFPSVKYQETMCTETLDTNVLQLADVLWFACHCDSSKLTEMPRVEKPIDGEKVLKFSCRDFLKALYELKSKCQTSAEKIVVKMMREYGTVKEALDFD